MSVSTRQALRKLTTPLRSSTARGCTAASRKAPWENKSELKKGGNITHHDTGIWLHSPFRFDSFDLVKIVSGLWNYPCAACKTDRIDQICQGSVALWTPAIIGLMFPVILPVGCNGKTALREIGSVRAERQGFEERNAGHDYRPSYLTSGYIKH